MEAQNELQAHLYPISFIFLLIVLRDMPRADAVLSLLPDNFRSVNCIYFFSNSSSGMISSSAEKQLSAAF